jgi:hypothetical protein
MSSSEKVLGPPSIIRTAAIPVADAEKGVL